MTSQCMDCGSALIDLHSTAQRICSGCHKYWPWKLSSDQKPVGYSVCPTKIHQIIENQSICYCNPGNPATSMSCGKPDCSTIMIHGYSRSPGVEASLMVNAKFHELQSRLSIVTAQRDELLDILCEVYTEYEKGVECYASPENLEDYVGRALIINNNTENRIADILDEYRPKAATAKCEEVGNG